ncbi:MAG: hypothetical protein ACRCZO_03970, partial [Cetobacterium sp.]
KEEEMRRMASPVKQVKLEIKDDNTIFGYIHRISECKVSLEKRLTLFNAVPQTNQDSFKNMAVFAPEMRTAFMQAEKNQSPIKVKNFTKWIGK